MSAAVFLRSDAITPLKALGVAVGFGGVLLIARPWDTAGSVDMGGVLYMLAGSLSIGLSFVYARRFLSGLAIHPAALTTYQMGLALVTLLILTDLDGVGAITGDPRALIALAIGLGLLGTGVAYILYYFIVGQLGAITASSVTYIPGIVALAIGGLLVHEPLDALDAAAVVLILTGVTMLRIRRAPALPLPLPDGRYTAWRPGRPPALSAAGR